MPDEEIRVARGAVHVEGEGVEPDERRGKVRGGRRPHRGREAEGTRQEVDAQVRPGRAIEELLHLPVRLARGEAGVELHEDELRDGQAEGPRKLADDHLRDQRLGALAGAVELDDVEAVVVGLAQAGQRAALAEGRDVAGRGDGAEHQGSVRAVLAGCSHCETNPSLLRGQRGRIPGPMRDPGRVETSP